jgi:hypothetical protein
LSHWSFFVVDVPSFVVFLGVLGVLSLHRSAFLFLVIASPLGWIAYPVIAVDQPAFSHL